MLAPAPALAPTIAPASDTVRSLAARRAPAERLARGLLVFGGGIGVGGLAYLGALMVWLQVAGFFGYLTGPNSPVDPFNSSTALVHVYAACALACAGLLLAWAGVTAAPGARWWSGWSVERFVAALTTTRWWLAAIAVAAVVFGLYARYVYTYHRLAGGTDEGLYLLSGRNAMAGGITYHDFSFIQGPLYPYLIGVFMAPFNFSEQAARGFAILTTAVVLLLAVWLATRLAGRVAGLLTLVFLVTDVDFLTEDLSGIQPSGATASILFLVSALLMLRGRVLWALVPLAVAMGSRVLFAPLFVVGVLAAAIALREAWRPVLVGSGLVAAVFGPFFLVNPSATWFGLIGLQLARADLIPRDQAFNPGLAARLQMLQNAGLDQVKPFLPVLLLLALGIYAMTLDPVRQRLSRTARIAVLFMLAGTVVMLLVDVLPYPYIARYPVPQLPLAYVAGCVSLALLLTRVDVVGRRLVGLFVGGLVVVNGMMAAANAVGGFPLTDQHYRQPLRQLDEVAAYVRQTTPSDGVIITLETNVVTQAQRRLWPGLEMSMWGVLDAPPEFARSMKMVTPEMLAEAIESRQAHAVVVSERNTWRMARLRTRARMEDALANNYRLGKQFDHLSDWGEVQVWLPPNSPVFAAATPAP